MMADSIQNGYRVDAVRNDVNVRHVCIVSFVEFVRILVFESDIGKRKDSNQCETTPKINNRMQPSLNQRN